MRTGIYALPLLLLLSFDAAALVNETQKLQASDAAAGDKFGISVAASTDVLVVGASEKDILFGTLVEEMGAAYVFERDANNALWTETARLTPIDGGTPAAGGSSTHGQTVAVSGTTIFVGAPGERAVYVYVRDGAGGWPHFQKISSPGAPGDGFGRALAASGDRLLVGALPAVYFYEYDAAKALWELVDDHTSTTASNFGNAVGIDGNYAVVGASNYEFSGSETGAAYVFTWNGEKWVADGFLRPLDLGASYEFGHSVSISGTTIAASASRFLLGAPPGTGGAGKGYVYDRIGGVWQLQAELRALDDAVAGEFGWSLDLQSNAAVVTDNYYEGPALNTGRAYVFMPTGASWLRVHVLEASDAALNDGFGSWSAISDNVALVGAWSEDDPGEASGAAYVFELNLETATLPGLSGAGALLGASALLFLGMGASLLRTGKPRQRRSS